MGMQFNLNGANGKATVRLKPWNIYEVTFKGIETIGGKTKDGNDWKAMKLKFASAEGIFEPMIFCPKADGGDVRPSGKTGDREWTMPSAAENLKFAIAHIGAILGKPALFEKMQGIAYDLPGDFDKLVANLNKVVADSVGKTTHLKLVGDSRGYAAIPSYVNISKEGDAYLSNNWLGDNLSFSTYEVNQMNKKKAAKPTAVEDTASDGDPVSEDSDDMNYDL